jgi:hypothetical protein
LGSELGVATTHIVLALNDLQELSPVVAEINPLVRSAAETLIASPVLGPQEVSHEILKLRIRKPLVRSHG